LLRELSNLQQQFLVIKALESTPVPTPKAYWYEADQSLLGGPFFLMEKRRVPLISKRSGSTSALTATARFAWWLSGR
jgi:aminoglycoside phosphotransferase (APT) family kinase protein